MEYTPNPELEKLRAEKEQSEKKIEQLTHKITRLENRQKYFEDGERKRRTHRLCTIAGTLESIALYHFHVDQIKRSEGQSVVASAAYRAGEKLHNEYYGEDSDYTNKGGVIYTEIFLSPHAPQEYADRETLWNAVEKVEKGKKAQLAYSFDISFQNEFTQEENIALARQFLTEHFISCGMVVDFAVHEPDREEGVIPNPHFHFMCPIRPIEQNGE